MKWFVIPAVFFSVLLMAFASPRLAQGLEYNFEDENQLGDWEIVTGEWSIEDGKLVGILPGDQPFTYTGIYLGNQAWTNYTFEVEATKVEGSYVYLNFRVQDNMDRYDFEASYGSVTTTIFTWEGDAATEIIPGGRAGRVALPEGDTHIYKVQVEGKKITTYIDDEVIYDFEDDFFPSGRVGLASTGSTVHFDNFKIEGEGIPMAVNPESKLATSWGRIKNEF